MEKLTVFGGRGFLGSEYIRQHYDAAIANIVSVNARDDYEVHSKDVLYFISTIHNFHVYSNPFLDIDTNLTTLVKVLENWRLRTDASEGVFNFVSSWFVNSGVKGFYTSTKRCAEELLESYCKAFGLRYRIIRLCNVLGKGDTKVSSKKNALQYVIQRLATDQDVTIRPVLREYLHVSDCARALDLIVTKGEHNAVCNIGSGKLEDFSEAAMYCYVKLGSKSRVTTVSSDDHAFLLNTTALFGLGFKPLRSFRSTLDEIAAEA